ncbi:MAG: hypothetical protein CVV05_07470 [Gammaproteobacteria bacterium HGW-Gammaproteobacteria-1]|nr:MAG: hypothetical protein CVV05_07470 [Gammaproteobacteria bacterium HGW-Gammaproteobacteria-1]
MTGFEVERAWNIVSKYEPDLVSIGIGAKDNSISMEFYERNCKFAKELESLFGVAVGHFEFSLTDPYETGAALIAYIDSHNGNYNTVVAPLNNKLSTIGAGLAAIKNKNIQLCYAQPEAYNAETYSVPDENCYVVDIQINEWEQ